MKIFRELSSEMDTVYSFNETTMEIKMYKPIKADLYSYMDGDVKKYYTEIDMVNDLGLNDIVKVHADESKSKGGGNPKYKYMIFFTTLDEAVKERKKEAIRRVSLAVENYNREAYLCREYLPEDFIIGVK